MPATQSLGGSTRFFRAGVALDIRYQCEAHSIRLNWTASNRTVELIMIVITGKARVSAANRETMLAIGAEQVRNSRAEPGCVSYHFYEDTMEPNAFFFYEEWRDQAAVDFHFKQPYCLAFIGKARAIALEEPKIVIRPI
jgi:quinol monooxygenase YgiN